MGLIALSAIQGMSAIGKFHCINFSKTTPTVGSSPSIEKIYTKKQLPFTKSDQPYIAFAVIARLSITYLKILVVKNSKSLSNMTTEIYIRINTIKKEDIIPVIPFVPHLE